MQPGLLSAFGDSLNTHLGVQLMLIKMQSQDLLANTQVATESNSQSGPSPHFF